MTKLMYLQYPNLFETTATIQGRGTDTKGAYLILDRSLFYPQGGGQPADQGKIVLGDIVYEVYDVRNTEGEVRHYINSDHFDSHTVKGEIKIIVDIERRSLNSRYHTAGHFIAAVSERLLETMTAIKGHQFPGEAYIEFNGIIPNPDDFAQQLALAVGTHLNFQGTIKMEDLDVEQAKVIAEHLPYALPANKSLRVCRIEGFDPVPCGGTHVNNLKDIGNVIIQGCKSKKGKTKVYYEVTV